MPGQKIPPYWLVLAASFGMHAPSAAQADPPSPWGVSPSSALSNTPQAWTRDMHAAGVTNVRGFHTQRTLSQLGVYRDAALSLSGFLMWSPDQPLTLPIAHLDGFRSYVTDTVRRYSSYVTSWEVWNEPPNFTADTSPASYATIVATAYDATKAVNPKLRVGLAAKSVHLRYLAEAISAGARDKFDFLSLHPYETADLISQGCDRPFLGIVSNTRAMLRERNPKRAEVPIWFSEVGTELRATGPHPVDEVTQADILVKIYTMAIAQGVERISWFDPRDSEGRQLGLQRGNGEARPAYVAYKTLSHDLGTVPNFLGYISLAADSFGFLFAGPDADVLVTWLSSGAPRAVSLAQEVSMLRPGRAPKEATAAPTLSTAPILLEVPHGSALSDTWRKRADRSCAPWDPHGADNEVAFVPGKPSPRVCMLNAPPLEAQRANNELDLAGTTAAAFAIDPQFLGYAGGALEVTLVARGHGSSEAGFNFKYESRQPLAAANDLGMVTSGGWTSVTGTELTTFTWTLKDASFAGKYGANIAIDCDSTTHCDFSIVSLRLRKK